MSDATTNCRDTGGRFTNGNPGGPGRPRRAIERHYLATLNDAVTLDDWRAIVQAAVDKAKQGHPQARKWLTQFLIGSNPPTLLEVSAAEVADANGDRELIKAVVERLDDPLEKLLPDAYCSAKSLVNRTVHGQEQTS